MADTPGEPQAVKHKNIFAVMDNALHQKLWDNGK
jgi:hypothetical protein